MGIFATCEIPAGGGVVLLAGLRDVDCLLFGLGLLLCGGLRTEAIVATLASMNNASHI
jgi:hypothetical protein